MQVEIRANIEDIKGSTGITDMGDPDISLKLKVQMPPGAYARLMSLQKQRVPMYLIIASDQAMFDLEIIQFKGEASKGEEPSAGEGEESKGELPAELGTMSLKPTEVISGKKK